MKNTGVIRTLWGPNVPHGNSDISGRWVGRLMLFFSLVHLFVCSAAILMIEIKEVRWAQGIQKVQVLESARCWFKSMLSHVIWSYLLNFSKLISSWAIWKIMLTLRTIVRTRNNIIHVRYLIYGYNLFSIYAPDMVSGTLLVYTLSLHLTAVLKRVPMILSVYK